MRERMGSQVLKPSNFAARGTLVCSFVLSGPCAALPPIKPAHPDFQNLTTLAFWLRSSVVSVLNSLTTIMGAPPSLLVI